MKNSVWLDEVSENEMLKPCPFCGAEGATLQVTLMHYVHLGAHGVKCLVCGAHSKGFVQPNDAVKAWNARV